MNELEKAWVGGYLSGTGSFQVWRRSDGSSTIRLVVKSTRYEGPIQLLAKIIDKRMTNYRINGKLGYAVTVQGEALSAIMAQLEGYLATDRWAFWMQLRSELG